MNNQQSGDFERERREAGLRYDWVQDGEDYYRLDRLSWLTFTVTRNGDHWEVGEQDHDAGLNDDGTTYTSYEVWDEPFPTWTAAAKAVEERRGYDNE